MGINVVGEERAAELLGVQLRTLRRWRKENRGVKYYVFAKKIMYDLYDIKEYNKKRGQNEIKI